MNMPVVIFGAGTGDELDAGNTLWYQLHSALGSGWVYSGVVTVFTPDQLKDAERAIPVGPELGPAGDSTVRSIAISLSLQKLYAYDGQNLFLETDVTTGMPELPTPQGTFSIFGKYMDYTFHSPWPRGSRFWYPDSPTTYAMLFRSGGYFIHDAPWRPFYGQGTEYAHVDPDGVWREGSHGCVNVPFDAVAALYHWAPFGSLVTIAQ